MNKFLITALSLGSLGLASAQTTAYTQAVGYVKLGNTTSGVAVPANTDITVSVPFHNKIEKSLTVDTAGATSITVDETLVANELAVASGAPYLVTVADGTSEGVMAVVTANTTSSLTVTPLNGGSLASIPTGSKLQAFKSTTLSTFFPSTIPPGTRCITFSNTLSGINVPSDVIYVYSGLNWIEIVGSNVGSNADDVMLLPGESFILRAAATAITDLVATGVVPDFDHMTPIPQFVAGSSQDTRISYFGSCADTLLDSSLGNVPGDRLILFDQNATGINKVATEIFVFSGVAWIEIVGSAVGTNRDNYKLDSGRGYIFRSAVSTPVGTNLWADEQTYRPNLYTP